MWPIQRSTGNVVNDTTVDCRHDIPGYLADDYCLPWRNDQISKQHDPAGYKTDSFRKNSPRVDDFSTGVREQRSQPSISAGYRQEQERAAEKSDDPTERAAA